MSKQQKTFKHTNNPRMQCINILLNSLPVTEHQQALLHLFPDYLEKLDEKQSAYAKNICFGVFRHYFLLNALINDYLHKKLKPKDADILCIFFIAAYELVFLNTPDHAVLSENVELCSKIKKTWAKGLVNAFLRNLQKKLTDNGGLKNLQASLGNDNATQTLELQFEHPLWIIKQLEKNWPEHYQSILIENNKRSPMTLRVNLARKTRANYLQQLSEQNIAASPGEFSQTAVYLDSPVGVHVLPGFQNGLVSVQDEAAQLATEFLKPQDGERILDACAAPGGKSIHILESAEVSLTCLDNQENRLKRVKENLERHHFSAECLVGDACLPETWWDNQNYDRILLDAPCSASGVIRRNPDIKLNRKPEDLDRLSTIQKNMLEALWPCLKAGGFLLYSTCSVFKQENQYIIETFLKKEASASLVPINKNLGIDTGFGLQLFPRENAHDGFFYALLKKT